MLTVQIRRLRVATNVSVCAWSHLTSIGNHQHGRAPGQMLARSIGASRSSYFGKDASSSEPSPSPSSSSSPPSSSGSHDSWKSAIEQAERLVHPAGGSVIFPRNSLPTGLLGGSTLSKLAGAASLAGAALNPLAATFGNALSPSISSSSSSSTSSSTSTSSAAPSFSDMVRRLVGKDMSSLTKNIQLLLQSRHPLVQTISTYYFDEKAGGKHVRPLLVLLLGKATSSLRPLSVLDSQPVSDSDPDILASQKQLAEITEMIHTASLLHDDVIDVADLRRGKPSANILFGNKAAVLGGDYLLAKASLALARLRNLEVVELLSTVIADLVEGEFMQLRPNNNNNSNNEKSKSNAPLIEIPPVGELAHLTGPLQQDFQYYMEKTFMKTASLIAKSCQASVALGGHSPELCEVAFQYGKNLGLAFQLVDDLLDYVVTSSDFGKPTGVDLTLGLATAPVLFASEEFPQLRKLASRSFSSDGDVKEAMELVYKSKGVQRTKELAAAHCQVAVDLLAHLPASDSRDVLVMITEQVLNRKK